MLKLFPFRHVLSLPICFLWFPFMLHAFPFIVLSCCIHFRCYPFHVAFMSFDFLSCCGHFLSLSFHAAFLCCRCPFMLRAFFWKCNTACWRLFPCRHVRLFCIQFRSWCSFHVVSISFHFPFVCIHVPFMSLSFCVHFLSRSHRLSKEIKRMQWNAKRTGNEKKWMQNTRKMKGNACNIPTTALTWFRERGPQKR